MTKIKKSLSIQKTFVLIILLIATDSIKISATSISNSDEEDILTFWQTNTAKLNLGTKRDIVLFFGMTGSGKSATVLFLIDEELEAVEQPEGSGNFILQDKNHKIGDNPLASQTIIPDLMVDSASDSVYFDCPGFDDNRGPKYDLTAAYSIQKLLTFARSVKIVFTIDFNHVQAGTTKVFSSFLAYVYYLIGDIDKFSNGIAVVVTKVKHDFHDVNGTIVWTDDQRQIESVEYFLRVVKSEMEKRISMKGNSSARILEDENFLKQAVKFIEIILQPERIGIFRRVNQTGLLTNMPHFRAQRTNLRKIVNENLKYVDKDNSDFNLTLSGNTKTSIAKLLTQLQNQMTSNITAMRGKIEEYYKQQATVREVGLISLYGEVSVLKHSLSQTYDANLRDYVKRFVNVMNGTGIIEILNNTKAVQRNYEFIDFLLNFTTDNTTPDFIILTLNQTIKTVGDENSEKVLDAIEEHLVLQVSLAYEEIGKFLSNQQQNADLVNMNHAFYTLHQHLSDAKHSNVMRFLIQFINASIIFEYGVPLENADQILKTGYFYNSLPDLQLKNPNRVTEQLDLVIANAKQLQQWYGFIIDMYENLTIMNLKKQEISYEDISAKAKNIIEKCSNVSKNETVTIDSIGLKQFLTDLKVEHGDMDIMHLDYFKLLPLMEILKRIFFTTPKIECLNNGNRSLITGYIVRLSDVIKNTNCWNESMEIDIFALDKVVFDDDIEKKWNLPGPMQLSIISPSWVVFERKRLHLIGKDGNAHSNPSADDGTRDDGARDGKHGKPGLPGFQGGNFFSIASKFLNWPLLLFNVNGGNAGPAQHGGKGKDLTH